MEKKIGDNQWWTEWETLPLVRALARENTVKREYLKRDYLRNVYHLVKLANFLIRITNRKQNEQEIYVSHTENADHQRQRGIIKESRDKDGRSTENL